MDIREGVILFLPFRVVITILTFAVTADAYSHRSLASRTRMQSLRPHAAFQSALLTLRMWHCHLHNPLRIKPLGRALSFVPVPWHIHPRSICKRFDCGVPLLAFS